jgi:broad specificity phosphatase PhoE
VLAPLGDGCRIYLLRHPELAADAAGLALGSGSADLGHRGRQTTIEWLQQFERIALDEVWSSPQTQCRDSAAVLALAKGLEPREDDRLRDQELGRWQGTAWDDLARVEPDRVRDFFQDFGEVQAPEGESLGQAVERFLDWWAERRSESLHKHLAVVVSGAMLTGFAAAMLGMRLSRAVALQIPHGAIGVLDVFDNGARIACWNANALDDEDTVGEREEAAREGQGLGLSTGEGGEDDDDRDGMPGPEDFR